MDFNRRVTDDANKVLAEEMASLSSMSEKDRNEKLLESVIYLRITAQQQPDRCLMQKEDCFNQFKDLVGGDNATVSLGPFRYAYKGKNAIGITLFAIFAVVVIALIAMAVYGAVDASSLVK